MCISLDQLICFVYYFSIHTHTQLNCTHTHINDKRTERYSANQYSASSKITVEICGAFARPYTLNSISVSVCVLNNQLNVITVFCCLTSLSSHRLCVCVFFAFIPFHNCFLCRYYCYDAVAAFVACLFSLLRDLGFVI